VCDDGQERFGLLAVGVLWIKPELDDAVDHLDDFSDRATGQVLCLRRQEMLAHRVERGWREDGEGQADGLGSCAKG
jgi:hypothetical protein